MKKILIILVFCFSLFENSNGQVAITYSYNFLTNSDYNLRDFGNSRTFRYKSNHNLNVDFEIKKGNKLVFKLGGAFQYFYGETNPRTDSSLISPGNYHVYQLVKKRRMNMVGLNSVLEYGIKQRLYFGINGIVGWSIINKINDYTPDGSYPWDENVLSQGPFFSISFMSKYKVFIRKKSELFVKIFLNDRFIELKSDFTIGLGLEFNFLRDNKE